MITKVPLTSEFASFSQITDFSGVLYNLKFYYSERADLWYMDIKDSSQVDLLTGVPLQTNVPLNLQYTNTVLPSGTFIMLHESDKDLDAGRNDLGSSVNLYYDDGL